MAYGLSASAVGKDFPWIFNPPSTYWDGLSIILKYIGGKEGGLDKLKGKTIGYIFFDGGYGREPLPLLARRLPRTTASTSRNIRCRRPTCRTSPASGSTFAATVRTG